MALTIFSRQPHGVEYSMYDIEEFASNTGISQLFACEHYYNTELCWDCRDPDPYSNGFDECTCDPNSDYYFIHIIVSVVNSDSQQTKITTKPINSVYQLNIVSGKFKTSQFNLIRTRKVEHAFPTTTFSIFNTMEIDPNVAAILKDSVPNVDCTKSSYFYTFDGVAKPEAYHNAFCDIFKAYYTFSQSPVTEQKTNPHVTMKTKSKNK